MDYTWNRGYKMKKILTVCLASALLLASCSTPAADEKSLYEHGLDIVSMLNEIVESDDYVSVYSASEDILSIVKSTAEGDHTAPNAVYQLTIPEESLLALSEVEAMPNLSDELRAFLNGRVQASVINIANSRNGANTLAATSICTVGKTFVNSEITENTIYLYTYENASPVAVSFTVGEDSTVSASGTFLLSEELNADTPEGIEEFFREITLEVEVVPAG